MGEGESLAIPLKVPVAGIERTFAERTESAIGKTIPTGLENLVRTGRVENLEFFSCTQQPGEYHVTTGSLCTEFVAFNLAEPAGLDAVRPYWSGVGKAARLPKGQFIAVHRDPGAELAGQVFQSSQKPKILIIFRPRAWRRSLTTLPRR